MRIATLLALLSLLAPSAWAGPTTPEEVKEQTTSKVDAFEGTTILESPWLDGPRSEEQLVRKLRFGLMAYAKAGRVERVLLLVTAEHQQGGPIRAERGVIRGGAEVQASTVDFQVRCPLRVCHVEERLGATLGEKVLRTHRQSGLEVSLRGRGRLDLEVPAFLIEGFVRRLDRELAEQKSAR